MKKLFTFFILTFGIFFGIFAQTESTSSEKPTIVVNPFDVKGVPKDEAEVLFEVFQSEFSNSINGKAKTVDRSSLEKIKTQQDFQNSDWSNTDKVAEMGKALNASIVVTGQIMMFKSNLVTTIKLIDVNTTEILSSVVEKTSNTDELFLKLSDMANKLAKNLALTELGKIYEIGDIGPGGGIVFYTSDTGFKIAGDNNVYHYLECSKEIIGTAEWCPCCNLLCNPITQTGFGYGKQNTENIINGRHKTAANMNGRYENKKIISISVSNCAAMLCLDYSTPTTKAGEWWLPSLDELDYIYKNLKKTGKIEGNYGYWSSSCCYYKDFGGGYNRSSEKRYRRREVLAVRAFNN